MKQLRKKKKVTSELIRVSSRKWEGVDTPLCSIISDGIMQMTAKFGIIKQNLFCSFFSLFQRTISLPLKDEQPVLDSKPLSLQKKQNPLFIAKKDLARKGPNCSRIS